ncbi:MAG: hypothetical protein ACE15F_24160 [bacterium]
MKLQGIPEIEFGFLDRPPVTEATRNRRTIGEVSFIFRFFLNHDFKGVVFHFALIYHFRYYLSSYKKNMHAALPGLADTFITGSQGVALGYLLARRGRSKNRTAFRPIITNFHFDSEPKKLYRFIL